MCEACASGTLRRQQLGRSRTSVAVEREARDLRRPRSHHWLGCAGNNGPAALFLVRCRQEVWFSTNTGDRGRRTDVSRLRGQMSCLDDDHELHSPGHCKHNSETYLMFSAHAANPNSLVRTMTMEAMDRQMRSWENKHIEIAGIVHRVAWVWLDSDGRNLGIACYDIKEGNRPVVPHLKAPHFTEKPVTCLNCIEWSMGI